MVCYKIYPELPKEVVKDGSASKDAVIPKNPIDVQDGFYHMCTHSQLVNILNRFYPDVAYVYVADINLSDDPSVIPAKGELGSSPDARLQWDKVIFEDTNEECFFPHIYGDITNKDVIKVEKITKSPSDAWAISTSFNYWSPAEMGSNLVLALNAA